jgi:hypothetical protein
VSVNGTGTQRICRPPKDFLALWRADLVFRKSCLVNKLCIRLSAGSTRISCSESEWSQW